jgi:hypothetical protein
MLDSLFKIKVKCWLFWDLYHERCIWMIQSESCFSKDLEACNMQYAKVLYGTYACIQVLEYQVWSKVFNVKLWYSHDEYMRC